MDEASWRVRLGRKLVVVISWAGVALVGPTTANAGERYLLLDDRVVDRVDHVSLRVGPVAKHPANPLMKEDRPWEVRFDNVYPNVVFDPGSKRYVCWYSPFIVDELTSNTPKARRPDIPYHSTPTREMGLCYATSVDGIHWEKPELNVTAFNGQLNNNLVMRHSHGMGVFRDEAEKDPARRFKAFGGEQVPGQKRRFEVVFSRDGIHWNEPLPCPEVGVEGDTHNNAFWAPALGKYVGITRRWLGGQRLVMRTESPDFTRWAPAVEVLRGDAESQTYAMSVFRYGNVYLGLLAMLNVKTDRVQCELAWSPDTVLWRRIEAGNALIPNATVRGEYDWGCVYAGVAPITDLNEIRLYYGSSNGQHTNWRDGFFALATLPVDRFAGYMAGAETGIIVTQPVQVSGARLLVNVAAPTGSLGVEVLDDRGEPVAGLSGESVIRRERVDDVGLLIRWKEGADLSELTRRPVRLKFTLRDARLYAFQFQ